MSSVDSSEICPLCKSDKIEPLQKGTHMCCDCHFVIDSCKPSELRNAELDQVEYSHTQTADQKPPLEDMITVADSSDATIVGMLSTTEEYVQELEGDAEDCIMAAELLITAWEKEFFRGRSAAVGIAAIIYLQFRQQQRPRPLTIVAQICKVSESELRTGYRSIKRHCNISPAVVTVKDYIPFLAARAELDNRTIEHAKSLVRPQDQITGSPVSIAAAYLYLAAKNTDTPLSLAEAGAVAGVAKETVWLKAQELRSADTI